MNPAAPPTPTRATTLRRIILINLVSCSAVTILILAGFCWMRSGTRAKPVPLPTPVIPDHGESMWRYDDRLGFAHVPATKGYHKIHNDKVTYTIDDHGWRITPDPANPRGRIVVVGCSFTFGDGVEDSDAFPYVLGRDYWPDYKVCNRASMAYGTGQAYLMVEDEMAGPSLPDLVLYGYTSGHVGRNYLDKRWLDALAAAQMDEQKRRGNPHFEIEDGRAVFKGVVGAEAGLPPSPELEKKSIEITIALIEGMDRMCKQKGVPFVLVMLPVNRDGNDDLDAKVIPRGVAVVDLRHLCTPEQYIPNDAHPAAPCHARIAEGIAGSDIIRQILSRR